MAQQTKYCPQCNRRFPDKNKFCQTDGTLLVQINKQESESKSNSLECWKCGAAIREGWKFCSKCQTQVTLIEQFPNSGTVNIEEQQEQINKQSFAVEDQEHLQELVAELNPTEPLSDSMVHAREQIQDVQEFPNLQETHAEVIETFENLSTSISPTEPSESQPTYEELETSSAILEPNSVARESLIHDAQVERPRVYDENSEPASVIEPEEHTELQESLSPSLGSQINVTRPSYDTVPSSEGRDVDESLAGVRAIKPQRQISISWKIGVAAASSIVILIVVIVAATSLLKGRRQTSPESSTQVNPSATPTVVAATTTATSNTINPPNGMVYIAGGTFKMGRDDGDEYERPTHNVTVAPFYIDRYEVTCEQYATFIEATGQPPPSTWVNGRYASSDARKPVTGVNWTEANAYAQWAGRRLPTEEEWEFAARGLDGRLYAWGNDWRTDVVNANGSQRRFEEAGSRPDNVSPFGVYDMIGNAWEWTSSNLTAYPGGTLPQQRPGIHKVLRGGCWQSNQSQATATYRFGWPAQGASDYRDTGFRCAMSVDAGEKVR